MTSDHAEDSESRTPSDGHRIAPEPREVFSYRFRKLSEEHGILESTGAGTSLKPGDKIEVLPSHCCTTINLHDRWYGIRDDGVEAIWDIAGRGRPW